MEERAPDTIYRIASTSEWVSAQAAGEFIPDRFDDEGFVHLSKGDQVLRPANLLYSGRDDLILLVIDVAKLNAELIYEPGSHGEDELFPHLYGPLNTNAVNGTIDFPCGPDGLFELPAALR